MDETPLHWIPRMNKTWEDKGAKNVEASGGKAKRSKGLVLHGFLQKEKSFFFTVLSKVKLQDAFQKGNFVTRTNSRIHLFYLVTMQHSG